MHDSLIKSFNERNMQWYEVQLETSDYLLAVSKVLGIQQLIVNSLGGNIMIFDTDDTNIETYKVFIFTDCIDYLDKVREKYFFTVCKEPTVELHLREKKIS